MDVLHLQTLKNAQLKRHIEKEGNEGKMNLILQVHDELVFEVPRADVTKVASVVKQEMENAIKLKVPVVVEVKAGPNWAQMEKV